MSFRPSRGQRSSLFNRSVSRKGRGESARKVLLGMESCEERILLATVAAYQNEVISAGVPTNDFTAIAAGDFNKDNKTDFATGGSTGLLTVFQYAAANTYNVSYAQQIGNANAKIIGLTSGLFDSANPTLEGIAVLNATSITMLESDGSGKAFTTKATGINLSADLAAGDTPVAITDGQFFGTAFLDLAVLTDKGNILIYKGAANDKFTKQTSPTQLTGTYVGLAAGYFDNKDANVDLAAVTATGGLTVLRGNGAGTFAAQTSVALDLTGVVGVATGATTTVTGSPATAVDQKLDILSSDGTIQVVKQNAAGVLNTKDTAIATAIVSSMAIASNVPATPAINTPDLFIAATSTVNVLAASALPVPATPAAQIDLTQVLGSLAKVDDTGKAGTIIASKDGSIRIGKGDGTGKFTYTTAPAYINATPLAWSVFKRDNGTYSDVAVVDDKGYLSVFLGNGADGFTTTLPNYSVNVITPTPTLKLVAVVTGSFTNSGDADLAVLDSTGTIKIYKGVGDGTFTLVPTPIAPPNGLAGKPTGMAAGVFKTANQSDLAVSYDDDHGTVAVYENIQFAVANAIVYAGAPINANAIVADKFLGNAFADIAVLTTPAAGNNQLVVLVNDKDHAGSFQPQAKTTDTGLTGLVQLISGDFDNDTKRDLAFVNPETGGAPGQVDIALGNGDGTFLPPVNLIATGVANPVYILSGDVDGDTFTDLGAINGTSVATFLATTSPKVSVTNVDQLEGDPNTGTAAKFDPTFNFTFTLVKATALTPLTLNVNTVDGTAKGGATPDSGIDYQIPADTTVTFAPATNSATFMVKVKADYVIEAPKRVFSLKITNTANTLDISGVTNANAPTGTIEEDDSTVVNTNKDNDLPNTPTTEITLRKAITVANATNNDPDPRFSAQPIVITFDPSQLPPGSVIQPKTALPAITGKTKLDGTLSGPGSALKKIEIDGTLITTGTDPGLELSFYKATAGDGTADTTADASTIQDVYIHGFKGDGILINTGTLTKLASAITITDNVVSDNRGDGVNVHSANTFLTSNIIGLKPDGTTPFGNDRYGVEYAAGTDNQILGGVGLGNTISANGKNLTLPDAANVLIATSGMTTIQGNKIGPDKNGNPLSPTPPANVAGIVVDVTDILALQPLVIGGDSAAKGNTIVGNTGDGIYLDSPPTALGQPTVSGNSINSNLKNGVESLITLLITGNGINSNVSDGVLLRDRSGGSSVASNTIRGNVANGVETVVEGVGITSNTIETNGKDGILFNSGNLTAVEPVTSITNNVVSDNRGDGVDIKSANSTITGNTIGLKPDGTTPFGNDGYGVEYAAGTDNQILGGVGLGNTISANGKNLTLPDAANVLIATSGMTTIQGNKIGPDKNGNPLSPTPPANVAGIVVDVTDILALQPLVIGGDSAAKGNTIVGNTGDGIVVIAIPSQDPTHPATISFNAIYDNRKNGVDIVTGNTLLTNNWIGLKADGTVIGNTLAGVYIHGPKATGNSIGSLLTPSQTPGHSSGNNDIIGNGDKGIVIADGASGNFVRGNRVTGNANADIDIVNATGNYVLGNSIGDPTAAPGLHGLVISGSSENVIGSANTPDIAFANTITAYSDSAVAIVDGSHNNQLFGNTITHASIGVSLNNASSNTIGQPQPAQNPGQGFGNVITDNSNVGVLVKAGSQNNLIAFNLISGNSNANVQFDASNSNQVQGNWIGTDAGGMAPYSASQQNGVILANGSASNTIGGFTANPGTGSGNVISGNSSAGVFLASGAMTNFLLGNLIGTDSSGLKALPNQVGVLINGATGNHVGLGTASPGTGFGNVISGNSGDGVSIAAGSTWNQIDGNVIGTDKLGNTAFPNGGNGVEINGSSHNGVGLASRNIISGNNSDGVLIAGGSSGNQVASNFIGLDSKGNSSVPNLNNGVEVVNSASNTIGGVGQGNTISGNGYKRSRSGGPQVNNNSGVGVAIEGMPSAGNQIVGNIIGLNSGGTQTLVVPTNSGSESWVGVLIEEDALGNNVDGNTISGNIAGGVMLYDINPHAGMYNTVQNNIIGLNQAGMERPLDGSNPGQNPKPYLQENGVLIQNASNSLIIQNTISGNGNAAPLSPNDQGVMSIANGFGNLRGTGVYITSIVPDNSLPIPAPASSGNFVVGNRIGTDKNGGGQFQRGLPIAPSIVATTAPARETGNLADGIYINNSPGNIIGTRSQPNYIAGNGGNGIHLFGSGTKNNNLGSNYIGFDVQRRAAGNNRFGILLDFGVVRGKNSIDRRATLTAGRGVVVGNNGGVNIRVATFRDLRAGVSATSVSSEGGFSIQSRTMKKFPNHRERAWVGFHRSQIAIKLHARN